MDDRVIAFLNKHRVCVLAVPLGDGSPHAATMHYSNQNSPSRLYFQTSRESLKSKAVVAGEQVRASVVVGFSEEDMLTLQMRGMIRVVQAPEQLAHVYDIHYAKQPQAKQYKDDPETMFLEFTPVWSRFTDFKTTPETIIEE